MDFKKVISQVEAELRDFAEKHRGIKGELSIKWDGRKFTAIVHVPKKVVIIQG